MRLMDMIVPLMLTAAIGIAMATQTAVNTQLKTYLNSPIQAAFFSFFIGTLCLAIWVILEPSTRPTFSQLANVPIWLWVGGVLGVYAISTSIYTAPTLGFLTFTGLVLFGQLLMSACLDHFGWLGVEQQPINWKRMIGIVCIGVGILFTLQR